MSLVVPPAPPPKTFGVPRVPEPVGVTRITLPSTSPREKIVVVFPVCGKDVSLALHHAEWLTQMATKWNHEAIISFDQTVRPKAVDQLHGALSECFSNVERFNYHCNARRYPAAANEAWKAIALEMHQNRRKFPWFWFEADSVALRPDWMTRLQEEYDCAGKSWMGVIVPGMGHLQGTAVYPGDAAARMPQALNARPDSAFDMAGHEETMSDRHDASHLMFHVWSILRGKACPVGGGSLPANITADQLEKWLPKTAVYAHRFKDTSVSDLLISGAFRW